MYTWTRLEDDERSCRRLSAYPYSSPELKTHVAVEPVQEVGSDNGARWRAVRAFVRRKIDQEVQTGQKRLCVEKSSTDADVWSSRNTEDA